MAPFISTIPVSDLALNAQLRTNERKHSGYGGNFDKCELLEMLQYTCEVEGDKVVCRPVERLFRR